MSDKVLTDDVAVPLDGSASARIDINSDLGHLTIDGLTGGEPLLLGGTLEYFAKQGVPARSLTTFNGHSVLEVKGGGTAQSWFRLPWSGCGGAYEWLMHLNPAVSTELKAHTNGGNVRLNLATLSLTHLAVDTAGGNMEVALPEKAANLSATVKSGGGNVTVEVGSGITGSNTLDAGSGGGNVEVRVPSGVAVKVHASTGMGKVIVDSRLSKTGVKTYQSADFDGAANRVEITAGSGAGNVTVSMK